MHNIPQISINQCVDLLLDLYLNAVKNHCIRKIPSAFLWGAAGIGKSQSIHQLAKQIEVLTGKKTNVIDIRLLLFSPVDLRGIPVADERKAFCNWLKPQIFNLSSSNDVVNILFLDELTAAPISVQAAAYQICLDKKIDTFEFPNNTIVIGAGNRTTDKSVSYSMPKALCNRFMHFEIIPEYASWKEWAISNDIDQRILAFISFSLDSLCTEPDTTDTAFPTPRSWEYVNTILKQTQKTPQGIINLIGAAIGLSTASEFVAYCEVYRNLPSIESILSGSSSVRIKSYDELYAISCSLIYYIKNNGSELTIDQLQNVLAYVIEFPSDFVYSFYNDTKSICSEDVKGKLINCPSWKAFIDKAVFNYG